jgi:hypothetical protein
VQDEVEEEKYGPDIQKKKKKKRKKKKVKEQPEVN